MCKQKMPCAPNATKVGCTEQMELSETVNSDRKKQLSLPVQIASWG